MTRGNKLVNKFVRKGYFANILQRKPLWILPVILFVFLTTPALAAPVEGFFLNHEQRQCYIGLSGDENGKLIPPYPWQEVDLFSSYMIQTQYGSCDFGEVIRKTISAEECCKKLGYTLITKIPGDWTWAPYPTQTVKSATAYQLSNPAICSTFAILFIVALAISLVMKLSKLASNRE